MKKLLPLLLLFFSLNISSAFAESVMLMEKEELKPLLGTEEVIILDVRTGRDWSTSEFKIPGAIRSSGDEFASWGTTYPKDKKIVLYCA